jgi:hypothetical protein
MKKAIICVAILFCGIGTAHAMSSGGPGGRWPASWPKELDPLRKQSWSWIDGIVGWASFDIPFNTREEFEAAWPHILKVRTTGGPITLMRGPHVRVKIQQNAGVRIRVHASPALETELNLAGKPMAFTTPPNGKLPTVTLYLIVDGQIVDLNRIPFPADTPIVDERFSPPVSK